MADDMQTERFGPGAETRWRFFTDGVMGGGSSGRVSFEASSGRAHAHMTGEVSTRNNGGFIQMQRSLDGPAPEGAKGVRLFMRGNDQDYFVHLRTAGTVLPWQYYQAGFVATRAWQEVFLPWEAFERSGRGLREVVRADRVKSIGIVAYGRDHVADIMVREVGFY